MSSLEIQVIAPEDCSTPKGADQKRKEMVGKIGKTVGMPVAGKETREVTITVHSMPSDPEQFTAVETDIKSKLAAMGFKLVQAV